MKHVLTLEKLSISQGPGGGGGSGSGGGGHHGAGSAAGGGPANPPNGVELATTLKWFSNTLLNVLKDVPGQPFLMMKSKDNDPERMALYPCLDYKGLYSTLLNFIDLVYDRFRGFFIPQYFCPVVSVIFM